ncbi:type I restriction enzyme subunit R domain-containing protein, partial [Streptococcus pyogenes]
KNLRYHGLIQAFSRTNRIYNATKTFGNIVTFRDLEKATTDAIKLFGKTETADILLERSYEDYMNGYIEAGQEQQGYLEVVKELQE